MAYELPVLKGQAIPQLLADGFLYKGETTPYTEIKEFRCTDDEVEVIFRDDKRESLIFDVEPGCSHQLPDMKIMIETHMMQRKTAVMSEDGEIVLNAPKFDTRKIRKAYDSAFSYGA